MTVDVSPQIHEGVATLSPVIDFDKPPQTIEEYRFGEPVTRDNFTYLLIDSFAKSRGSLDAQAYYMRWLQIHSGTNIPTVIRDFIDKKGLHCLTEAEGVAITSAYESIRGHKRIKDLETENDRSFSYDFSGQLDDILKLYQNLGKKVFLKSMGTEINVKEMDESVLAMKRPDFLNWIATKGRSISLLEIVRRR